jgi:hypothetical protein
MTRVMFRRSICFDKFRQIVNMGFQRILAAVGSLAFAEAHVIGNDDPVRRRKRRDKIPVKIAPGGFTMQAKDRIAVALVDVMHTKAVAVEIARRKGPCSTKGFERRNHVAESPGTDRRQFRMMRVIPRLREIATTNRVAPKS